MDAKILTKEFVSTLLPKRPENAHKGTFGRILIIGGSKFYMGAPYLVAASSYRSGAGLVTLASIENVCNFVVRKLPEVTLLPLPEENGVISKGLDSVYEKLKEFAKDDVVVVGPGLSTKPAVANFIEALFTLRDLPKLIIDGDGINILSKINEWWEIFDEHNIQAVLTPHPKEFSRLTNLGVEEIQKDRENLAKYYAANVWGQTLVLKGANTIIASHSGEIYLSPFANPLLATAGTGDILSGILAGMLAQGLTPFDASNVSVYIHGLCGEELKKDFGSSGAIASDLLIKIPKILVGLT